MRPKNPRTKFSSFSSNIGAANRSNQICFKVFLVILGKIRPQCETPHLKIRCPPGAHPSISETRRSWPNHDGHKAILSPYSHEYSNSGTSTSVYRFAEIFHGNQIIPRFPLLFKNDRGYLREEGLISSILSFSRIFFREVAWRDLEAWR